MIGQKQIIVIIGLVFAILLIVCNLNHTENNTNIVKMQNPFIKAETLDVAAQGAGFALFCPETFKDYKKTQISFIRNKLIEVTYGNAQNSINVRKSNQKKQDISGDYNHYVDVISKDLNGLTVTYKGHNDEISTAIFADDDYSYSIHARNPLTKSLVDSLILQIR